jgi:hypothetical protein
MGNSKESKTKNINIEELIKPFEIIAMENIIRTRKTIENNRESFEILKEKKEQVIKRRRKAENKQFKIAKRYA